MKRTACTVVLLAMLAGTTGSAEPKKTPKENANQKTFVGCVDQQGDNYVLTGDKMLRVKAVLQGDGFPNDAFAKHVGHKVQVKGTLGSDADPKTILVKTVTTVANECVPEGE